MAAVAPLSFSAIVAGSHHAMEGVQMSTALARLYSAISLSLIALLLPSSIVHAQRSGESRADVYRIDSQTSDIRLLVYRDPPSDLKNRVCLVTGASRGIGAAVAQGLGAACRVGVHFKTSRQEAENVARGVSAKGGRAHLLQGDISDPGTVERASDC